MKKTIIGRLIKIKIEKMGNNTKKDLLVTLADRNYIQQAKQLFSSVYWNAGWKGDYMLLSHDIPEKELKWFRDKGILVKKCKPLSNKGWGSWPPALLDKFYLFTPEFKKWEHVVYLDADIIVRANLDRLTKKRGFWASAIFPPWTFSDRFKGKLTELKSKFLELKKIDPRKDTFNAGVFVFNTEIIKEDFFFLMNCLYKKYKNFIHGCEETVLNIFFRNWKKLPFIYNIPVINLTSLYNIPENAIIGAILHFSKYYGLKTQHPWDKKSYFYNEWKNNLDKADFIDLNKIPKGEKLKFVIPAFKIKEKFVILKPHINKIIGQTGIFIKKLNPAFYYKLKKIKDGKNEKQH